LLFNNNKREKVQNLRILKMRRINSSFFQYLGIREKIKKEAIKSENYRNYL